MKYIFPKQFGLHNVFSSTVDSKETAQPFKDYTLREGEIAQSERGSLRDPTNAVKHNVPRQRIPKRLRGELFALVRKLQLHHSRCSYHQLLIHYCPLRVGDRDTAMKMQFNDCLRLRNGLVRKICWYSQIVRK